MDGKLQLLLLRAKLSYDWKAIRSSVMIRIVHTGGVLDDETYVAGVSFTQELNFACQIMVVQSQTLFLWIGLFRAKRPGKCEIT